MDIIISCSGVFVKMRSGGRGRWKRGKGWEWIGRKTIYSRGLIVFQSVYSRGLTDQICSRGQTCPILQWVSLFFSLPSEMKSSTGLDGFVHGLDGFVHRLGWIRPKGRLKSSKERCWGERRPGGSLLPRGPVSARSLTDFSALRAGFVLQPRGLGGRGKSVTRDAQRQLAAR